MRDLSQRHSPDDCRKAHSYLSVEKKIMTIMFIWYLKAMDGLMIELMSTLSLEKMSIKRFASMRKSIIGKSGNKHGG